MFHPFELRSFHSHRSDKNENTKSADTTVLNSSTTVTVRQPSERSLNERVTASCMQLGASVIRMALHVRAIVIKHYRKKFTVELREIDLIFSSVKWTLEILF